MLNNKLPLQTTENYSPQKNAIIRCNMKTLVMPQSCVTYILSIVLAMKSNGVFQTNHSGLESMKMYCSILLDYN